MKPSPFDTRGNRKHKLNSDMNVVPYIDVMLVLLIIFMVTTPMLTTGVSVDLPKAQADSLSTGTKMPVIVSILNDGSITLSSEAQMDRLVTQEELIAALVEQQQQAKDSELIKVMINADQQNQYGVVVELMASLQQAGIQKVGLLTGRPLPQPES